MKTKKLGPVMREILAAARDGTVTLETGWRVALQGYQTLGQEKVRAANRLVSAGYLKRASITQYMRAGWQVTRYVYEGVKDEDI